jgi:hypothetical protein
MLSICWGWCTLVSKSLRQVLIDIDDWQRQLKGRVKQTASTSQQQSSQNIREAATEYIYSEVYKKDGTFSKGVKAVSEKISKQAEMAGRQAFDAGASTRAKESWEKSTGAGNLVKQNYQVTPSYSAIGNIKNFPSKIQITFNHDVGQLDRIVTRHGGSYPLWMILEYGIFAGFDVPDAALKNVSIKGGAAQQIGMRGYMGDSMGNRIQMAKKPPSKYVPVISRIHSFTGPLDNWGRGQEKNTQYGWRMAKTNSARLKAKAATYGLRGRHFVFAGRRTTMMLAESDYVALMSLVKTQLSSKLSQIKEFVVKNKWSEEKIIERFNKLTQENRANIDTELIGA